MRSPASATRLVIAVVVSALALALAGAAAAFTFDVPKPAGFVTDQVGVLDAGTKARLEALNEELRRKTGAEIAVVVVPTTEPEPIFDYAMAIAEKWKPGSRDKDNGVVFLVAVQDRQMYILTGYGVEGVLPDGRVGEIRDEIVAPAFRRGDYAGGIWAATRTMAALIAQDAGVTLDGAPAPPPRAERRSSGPGLSGLIVLVVIFLLLRGMFRGRGRGRGFRGGRRSGDSLAPFILGSILGRGFGGRGHGGFGGGGFGGFGGRGGGGFGGFGGGSFGGGGAGGSW